MRKLRLNEIRRNAMLLAARRTSTAEEVLKYTVTGNIVDPAESGIEGATVTVTGTSLTDDSAATTGAFSIANVPKGGRTLTITKADFQTKVVPVSVNGNTAAGDIVLYQYFDIAGNIVDGAAAALEGVAVTLYADAAKTTALATTTTDASGDYSFTGTATAGAANAEITAENSPYYVEAVLAGYTADEDPLEVAVAADVADADFVLTADA